MVDKKVVRFIKILGKLEYQTYNEGVEELINGMNLIIEYYDVPNFEDKNKGINPIWERLLIIEYLFDNDLDVPKKLLEDCYKEIQEITNQL